MVTLNFSAPNHTVKSKTMFHVLQYIHGYYKQLEIWFKNVAHGDVNLKCRLCK